jgi:hypothetical protein
MSPDNFAEHVTECLRADIDALGPMTDSAAARRSRRRMMDLAEHAPDFMHMLAGPLLDAAGPNATATLLACARVHLYARVLDDALDDNLLLDRRNLLRIQPLFWQAVYALGAQYPAQAQPAAALIQATVDAVERDNARPAPAAWGLKNFHLLLLPLLLSGDSIAYRAVLPGLESVIALAQAHEEAEQGRLNEPGVHAALAASVAQWVEPARVDALARHGWGAAAARLVRDGDALLSRMNRTMTPV